MLYGSEGPQFEGSAIVQTFYIRNFIGTIFTLIDRCDEFLFKLNSVLFIKCQITTNVISRYFKDSVQFKPLRTQGEINRVCFHQAGGHLLMLSPDRCGLEGHKTGSVHEGSKHNPK